jgi:large repetitive protein
MRRDWKAGLVGVCILVLALLAGCGGGGADGERETLYVELGYDPSVASIRQPLTVRPYISGLGNRTPVCTVAGGALPPGMTLGSDCVFSGAPTTAGSYSVGVRLTSPGVEGFVDSSASFLIDDPTPSLAATQSIDQGQTGQWRAFIGQTWRGDAIVQLRHYTPKSGDVLTYAVTSGALPSGIALDTTTGALSGVTSTYGRSSFTMVATLKRNGIDYEAVPAVAVTIDVVESTVVIEYSACDAVWAVPIACSVSVRTQPIAGSAFRYTAAALPAGFTLDPVTGTFSGTPATLISEGVPVTATWTLPDGRAITFAPQLSVTTAGSFPSYEPSVGMTGVVSGPTPENGMGALTTGLASGQAFSIPMVGVGNARAGDVYLFELVQRDANFVVPAWVRIDPTTGTLSGTPPVGAVGITHQWTVRLTTQRNGFTLATKRDWSATVQ